MSYAMPGQAGPETPKARPATVTAATWLLLVAAVAYVIIAVLGFWQAGTFADVFEEAYAGTELDEVARFLGTVTAIFLGIFYLLFAVGFSVLALFDYRGKNPARITTWVIGGVALCCTGLSLVSMGLDAAIGADLEGGPDAAELERLLDAALPGWYYPATWGFTGLTVVALLAALILLAMPSANAFFRKSPPAAPPPPYPQAPPPYPQAGQ